MRKDPCNLMEFLYRGERVYITASDCETKLGGRGCVPIYRHAKPCGRHVPQVDGAGIGQGRRIRGINAPTRNHSALKFLHPRPRGLKTILPVIGD